MKSLLKQFHPIFFVFGVIALALSVFGIIFFVPQELNISNTLLLLATIFFGFMLGYCFRIIEYLCFQHKINKIFSDMINDASKEVFNEQSKR